MSSTAATATSYAMLGLLAMRPWSTYELAQQMSRGVGRMWPRTQSKLYEAPKELVALGLARSTSQQVGRRTRTVYSITAKGRRALAAWLQQPGAGPVLEFEQLLKIFFAENGTRDDALRTLAAAGEWARQRSAESLAIGQQYLAGEGPFPERLPEQNLCARFLTDFYVMVGEWARWAAAIVETWPDDPRQASVERRFVEEIVRRAARGADTEARMPRRRQSVE